MLDLIYACIALSMPFTIGVVVGVEIVKRRPKSTNEKLGEVVKARIMAVYEDRQWVGTGLGIEVSNTMELDLPGDRKVEIIVREAA